MAIFCEQARSINRRLYCSQEPGLNALFSSDYRKSMFRESWESRKLLVLLRLTQVIPVNFIPIMMSSSTLSFFDSSCEETREALRASHVGRDGTVAELIFIHRDEDKGALVCLIAYPSGDDAARPKLSSNLMFLRMTVENPFFSVDRYGGGFVSDQGYISSCYFRVDLSDLDGA